MELRCLCTVLALVSVVSVAAATRSPEWRARTELAKRMDIGESAPDWLMDSETYGFAYSAENWAALVESKVAFVTHCPASHAFFERAHALGIRCFPYVTFYQGFANMTYEGVNLKDHPEFIEVDQQGNLVRTGFWESEDAKNMYTTCPNVKEYQDAMVAWVRKLMELGADGVFVDNLGKRVPCHGPKFGKHKHIYKDQEHAFAMLLKRVREVVQHYQPEGAVLGNSAYPPSLPHEYWRYLDAEMLESYICTWVSTERWMDWKTHWNKVGKDLQPYVKAGKQIQALSYLGHTPYGVAEDGFFCYATARLAGFVWNGGLPLSDPDTAALYRLRLGMPLTEELEQNGVHYRVFERGLVAVNPEKDKPLAVKLDHPVPTTHLHDLLGVKTAAGWNHYESNGYALDESTRHSGANAIRCSNADTKGGSGAAQTVILNQEQPIPLLFSGWSKVENVNGDPGGDYSLYADVTYADGTYLYAQIAPFGTGTHDWEFKSVTIRPEKPIRSLMVHALFRRKTGIVWFDEVSLREALNNQPVGQELLRNGGFEEVTSQARLVDLSKTDGILEIPRYSGRVYLFLPSDTRDDLAITGPKLTVITSPSLGEVRFRVDGFDYWTHSGRWTTEYVLGPSFGKFDIVFEKPGKHIIEIVDMVPADIKTPKGYATGERLGEFMDPSNPTKPSAGRKFHFRQWAGRGKSPKLELDVSKDTTLTAEFNVDAAQQ